MDWRSASQSLAMNRSHVDTARDIHLKFDPSLPQVRRAADALMLAACGLGGLVALGVGWQFGQLGLAAVFVAALSAASLLLFALCRGSLASSLGFPVLLTSFVALHLQLAGGRTEYHFGVFVALAFLLAYRHWLPVLAGGVAVAVHHVAFDRLQAFGFPVFCLQAPDFFAVVLHAAYVVLEVAFGMYVAVRMRQDALLSAELGYITKGLSAATGQISFAAVERAAHTKAAEQLLKVLGAIRDATVVARESATLVSGSSSEIANGSSELSSRTAQNAQDLQHTASVVVQLTTTVSSTAETAKRASDQAESVSKMAGEGEVYAQDLSRRMQLIAESSRKVADITGVIDGIAFQTNILALNAAVEAARAGSHGKGFAVVASEVRRLAQHSASAAGEIRKLIEDSTTQVESGVAATGRTRDALGEILAEINGVHGLLSEVSRATSEQHGGIAEVNESLATLDQATQQNAALVKESSAAAMALEDQAAQLSHAMAVFDFGNARLARA